MLLDFEKGLLFEMEGSAIRFDLIKEQFLSHVDESSRKAFMKMLTTHNKKNAELDKETQVFFSKINEITAFINYAIFIKIIN